MSRTLYDYYIGYFQAYVGIIRDAILARLGAWALRRVYGPGCGAEPDPDCLGCSVGRVLKYLDGVAARR